MGMTRKKVRWSRGMPEVEEEVVAREECVVLSPEGSLSLVGALATRRCQIIRNVQSKAGKYLHIVSSLL